MWKILFYYFFFFVKKIHFKIEYIHRRRSVSFIVINNFLQMIFEWLYVCVGAMYKFCVESWKKKKSDETDIVAGENEIRNIEADMQLVAANGCEHWSCDSPPLEQPRFVFIFFSSLIFIFLYLLLFIHLFFFLLCYRLSFAFVSFVCNDVQSNRKYKTKTNSLLFYSILFHLTLLTVTEFS